MKKKTLYAWTVVILSIGILLSILSGVSIEKLRSAENYERTEHFLEMSGNYKSENREILEKYGMEQKDFRYVPAVVCMAGIIAMVGAAMAVLALAYAKSQNQKISEMEQYCEHILNGNYALDLRDNEEGQFSILKNKVYDITVMLNEKNRYLEENKKETEKLIADISHQLKTPITSLNMINELLYMDLPREKKAEFLDNMQEDLMKIEWFVKTILNLAKLDSGTLVLKREEVNALELSAEIINHFQIFCEINESEIQVSGAEEICVLCDKKWTREAINNLVKNAIEHGAKHVTFNWESNYIYTKLEVTDDGEGISEEELPHIFERFYKTKNSKADSVGLGLAFCKSIIDSQNGDIKVRSKKGEGTTFTIKIYQNLP